MNLTGRSVLTLKDFLAEDIEKLVSLARDIKQEKKLGIFKKRLANKNIVLIFEKNSTRTRCAFEVAAFDEGANVTFLTQSQVGKKESVKDSALVLGWYYDAIGFRGFEQETVETLAKFSGIPVWNGLTNAYHPTQILADLLTIQEHVLKPLRDVKIAFIGDCRSNTANSWRVAASKLGMHFVGVGPRELWPTEKCQKETHAFAEKSGAKVEFSEALDSVKQADVIYTDVWVSMGEEDYIEARINQLKAYKVTEALMAQTENSHCVFMHCLPALHNFETDFATDMQAKGLDVREVDEAVFYSKNSIVFDQAENRIHTIKAVMLLTLI